MKLIKVGAAALNQTPLAWAHNIENIVVAIKEAKEMGIKILCLPELCVTGYGCEDQFYSESLYENAYKALSVISEHTKGIIVAVGIPILYNSSAYNTACLMVDGKIAGFIPKQFLAGDGVHYEGRWFKAWPKDVREKIDINGSKYNIGDIYFDVNGIRIGIEVCEDAWVSNRPGGDLARNGVDFILNLSASHFAFGKHEQRINLVRDSSRAFNCTYIYSNLLGNESGRTIYDGGCIIASCGKIKSSLPQFSFKNRQITSAVIDLSQTRTNKVRTASLRPEMEKPLWINTAENFLEDSESPTDYNDSCLEILSKEEEFGYAVSLGLFDYLRKSKTNGYVISLSGGADSAACAVLVWLMCRVALKQLGPHGFKNKLDYIDFGSAKTAEDFTNKILTCVYQSTRNSSKQTMHAAKKLADFIGAEWYNVDIDPIVLQYKNIFGDALGVKFNWKNNDIVLQNIQARARAPGAWILANFKNSILISASNRSEAAVGYATMDGDTSGGLAPIAGVDKHFLRRWLKYMEKFILALENINTLKPSAELRPSNANQTDESDLMPYDVLDWIEEMAIRDKKSPIEILKRLTMSGKYPINQYATWVEKFFYLWSKNQWKRERYAPSFHLDDESLDPKTWCRFPILSGGFDVELKNMWDYVRSR